MTWRLDKLDLDEMLLAAGDAEFADHWASLLADPDASQKWANAVQRRARLDEVASRVHAHPWLAAPLWRLRLAARGARRDVGLLFNVTVLSSPLMAGLGPEPEPPPLDLSGPTPEAIPVASGRIVHFSVEPGTVVHYATADAQGTLPSRQWQMVAGESPVLITAVVPGDGPTALRREGDALVAAIEAGTVVGSVILEELVVREKDG